MVDSIICLQKFVMENFLPFHSHKRALRDKKLLDPQDKPEDDGFALKSSLVALLPDKSVGWALPTEYNHNLNMVGSAHPTKLI